MDFKVTRRVPSHYVSDDCLQQMLGYRHGIIIIDSKGITYEDTDTNKVNNYLEDDRRFNFPYYNIPTHIQKFGLKKYKFVNQILDFNKIYLHFTPQGMFTQQALKNGEEGLVVYERLLRFEEPKETIVSRKELDDYFDYKENKFYIFKGQTVDKLTFPTNEKILEYYKKELRKALISNTTNRTLSIKKIDEIIDVIINGITLSSIPSDFRFISQDNNMLIITDEDGKIKLEKIDVVFMSEDSFKITTINIPINSYTLDDIKDMKIYEQREPKISLWLNKDITRKDLQEAKRVLKK